MRVCTRVRLIRTRVKREACTTLLPQVVAKWPWVTCFISLSLSFLISEGKSRYRMAFCFKDVRIP